MRRFALRLLPHPLEFGRDRAIQALIRSLPKGEPSRLARVAARLGLFAVPVTLLGFLLVRSGRVELAPSLAALACGLLVAAAALVCGVTALLHIWRYGNRGAAPACLGIVCGVLLLALPAAAAFLIFDLPPIHDITTDAADPPPFIGVAARRSGVENAAAYPGKVSADRQAVAYPGIGPLEIDFPPEQVYAAALALVGDAGWTVLEPGTAPPEGGSALIEARGRSLVLGFPQDVAIRIRPDGDGSRVDMRSASRIGRHDLGWNARRVAGFLRDLGQRTSGRAADED